MKQIIFTTLLFAFLTINRNVYCGPIVASNCPEFNGTCLSTSDRYTDIEITVNFYDSPELENTNWSVHFTTNINGGTFELLNKSLFSPSGTYIHEVYLPPSINQMGFAVYLMSENNITEWDREAPFFNICNGIVKGENNTLQLNPITIVGPINPRLSNHDAVTVEKDISTNFDSSSFLNQSIAARNRIYPNPIKTHFIIEYYAIKDKDVKFQIYDINGRRIYETKFIHQNSGFYTKYFNELILAKGIYYCKIHSAKFQKVIKVQKL